MRSTAESYHHLLCRHDRNMLSIFAVDDVYMLVFAVLYKWSEYVPIFFL